MTTSAQTETREGAWTRALQLHDRMDEARVRGAGGPGGAGYRDPHTQDLAARLRVELDALVKLHGFEGTRADPVGLSWIARQSASWSCPPVREVQP